MAKFGKKYKTSQIEEWKSHYINYKAMKQKIKSIKKKIESRQRDNTLNLAEENSLIPSLNVIPILKGRASLQLDDLSLLYRRKYGQDLKEFIELLDSELNKCYLFYIKLEKELFKKVNTHLYTQTNYPNYNTYEIYMEMKKLNKTVFLIKCMNSFIYNNMNALKYILKKFDSKLSTSCGKIQTKYIFHQLTLQENRLEKILKYKTIDEALIICESNLKELLKYYNQNQNQNIINQNPNIMNQNMNFINQNMNQRNKDDINESFDKNL
jgi:SPX domain protein involved in polyphosphate accumulation